MTAQRLRRFAQGWDEVAVWAAHRPPIQPPHPRKTSRAAASSRIKGFANGINLRQNHSVTLALDDTKKGVVILEGTAELPGRGDASVTLQAYGEKYREGLRRIGVTVEAFTTLYSQPIRVTPVRLITWQ